MARSFRVRGRGGVVSVRRVERRAILFSGENRSRERKNEARPADLQVITDYFSSWLRKFFAVRIL
ncbi:hypothetical protein FRAAL1964 [Frankia alni ACN14a]|uniref:Uncharacterized protein n=1 Tax=Frankia alni (strain DSM 45986 / CECT 9034 / ACN14a) TaxID=326424 RepID=Q0RPB9_FRAAA|nr:hypothetical protein FRAAL1964 [Frankia alni ACN14a]